MRWMAVAVVMAAGVAFGEGTLPSEGNKDLLSEYIATQEIGRQRALTLYHVAMEKSDKAMKGGEYAVAADAAREANLILEINRQYFGDSESATMHEGAKASEEKAGAYLATAAGKAGASTGPSKSEAADVARARRQKSVAMAMEDARKFSEQRRYIEAIDALRQALVLDANNDEAKLQLRLLQEKVGYRAVGDPGPEGLKQGVAGKEATVPYNDVMVYPDDWVEKTRVRQGE